MNAAENAASRERTKRRATLERGLLACYEVIDMARKELAELDAADAAAIASLEAAVKEKRNE